MCRKWRRLWYNICSRLICCPDRRGDFHLPATAHLPEVLTVEVGSRVHGLPAWEERTSSCSAGLGRNGSFSVQPRGVPEGISAGEGFFEEAPVYFFLRSGQAEIHGGDNRATKPGRQGWKTVPAVQQCRTLPAWSTSGILRTVGPG